MSCRVLLIMEQGASRRGILSVLGPAGYEVMAADTSAEGLELFYAGGFQCVVIDESIGTGYGLELAKTMLICNGEIGVIMIADKPDEISAKINGETIWDVLPKACPFSIRDSVKEICEFVTMPKEQATALIEQFDQEVTTMKKIGNDALNDTGMFKAVQAPPEPDIVTG